MSEKEVVLSFLDVKAILKRSRYKVLLIAVVAGLTGAVFSLKSPPGYTLEATFREKNNSNGGMGNLGISQLLGMASTGQDSHSVTLMKSRTLMKPIVERHHLNATLARTGESRGWMGVFRDNLMVQWGHFRRSAFPVLPDPLHELSFDSVQYNQETPLQLVLHFADEQRFEVRNIKGDSLGGGALGEKIAVGEAAFQLKRGEKAESLSGKSYVLTILSPDLVAENYSKAIKVEADPEDPRLIHISLKTVDRKLGEKIVNELMDGYQVYLKQQQDRNTDIQLSYLNRRKKETFQDLKQLFEQHAALISKGFHKTGFIDSKKEMEFLSQIQWEGNRKLQNIEMEKKLLSIRTGDNAKDFLLDLPTGEDLFASSAKQLRALQERRDQLSLSLQRNFTDAAQGSSFFEMQIGQIGELEKYLQEVHAIKKHLETSLEPLKESTILQNPSFAISFWYDELKKDSTPSLKSDFHHYLDELENLLSSHVHLLRSRLACQQGPCEHFEGIDLDTATAMYVAYQRQLDDLEMYKNEFHFALEKMKDPDFELSSLSHVLKDPVSAGIIKDSLVFSMQLRNEPNRTEKEQNRMRNELIIQKQFLASHVKQLMDLNALQQTLVQGRLQQLKNASLDSVHQQIDIITKQIQSNTSQKSENLTAEQQLIETHLKEVRKLMQGLPEKWISEQELSFHLMMHQTLVENLSKLVDSKNITHHLELMDSTPLDRVLLPILPDSPKTILFASFAAFLGALMASIAALISAVLNNMPAIPSNVSRLNLSFCGVLSRPASGRADDEDLKTLRLAANFIDLGLKNGKRLAALMMGDGPNYASDLALLLSKQQKKVLCIELPSKTSDSSETGLMSYLEENKELKVVSAKGIDWIASGGPHRYALELLSSHTFAGLLKDLQKRYDVVLLLSSARPQDAETQTIAALADMSIVTVHDSSLQDLEPLEWIAASGKRVAVLF